MSTLRDTVIEYIEARDQRQNHVHLRLASDGEFYVDEDTNYGISLDEFNQKEDCTITLLHQQGWGGCNLSDDWTSTDAGSEEIDAMVDHVKSLLITLFN